MTGKHLSDEQLTDLIYGKESSELQDVRAHLQSCESCRERYGNLSEALDWMNRLPVPELSASEKTRMFEAAWQTPSFVPKKRSPGFIGAFLRHALSFSAGLTCGLILLAIAVSHTDAEVKNTEPPMEITQPKNPVPPMLSGTPAAKVYSKLENPVIVVRETEQEKTTQSKQSIVDTKRCVVEGTMENGSVLVVWNL